MVLFRARRPASSRASPGGSEVDAERYMRVLSLGMGGARAGGGYARGSAVAVDKLGKASEALSPDDWRMLAHYSWLTGRDGSSFRRASFPPALGRLAR